MRVFSLFVAILSFVALLACEDPNCKAKSAEPETPDCKEKIKIIVPEGGALAELECDVRQVAEILDKPMPGAQHAQWVVRCACPKPPTNVSPSPSP